MSCDILCIAHTAVNLEHLLKKPRKARAEAGISYSYINQLTNHNRVGYLANQRRVGFIRAGTLKRQEPNPSVQQVNFRVCKRFQVITQIKIMNLNMSRDWDE